MSRLASMSPAAIKSVFSPDSDADLIMLLTIYDPVTGLPSLRLTDGYTTRLSETDDNIVYGVVSRTNEYTFIPMEISFPTEEEAQAPRSSIVLHDVTRYVIPVIRNLSGPPSVTLEIILTSTPDTVEVSFTEFYISHISYNRDSVNLELTMIDYDREPFPKDSFTPAIFPGMF